MIVVVRLAQREIVKIVPVQIAPVPIVIAKQKSLRLFKLKAFCIFTLWKPKTYGMNFPKNYCGL